MISKLTNASPLRGAADLAPLVLRVGLGAFMVLNHGLPKLLGFAEKSAKFASWMPLPSPVSLSLAVFGELVCAALVVVGLATRVATVPVIITMLVAALGAHSDDPLGDGEHALIFAIGFAAIALLGPGRWSLDAILGRRA